MKITIDTNILDEEDISLGEFLLVLIFFYGYDYKAVFQKAIADGLLSSNLFENSNGVLSDNASNHVARILIASDPLVQSSGIDYYGLAKKLQDLFPDGCKAGTSYHWKSPISEVAFKLMALVYNYQFTFTEQEAINATKEYLDSFNDDKKHMQLLKYFILKTIRDNNGVGDIQSSFMTIIENNRENKNNKDETDN